METVFMLIHKLSDNRTKNSTMLHAHEPVQSSPAQPSPVHILITSSLKFILILSSPLFLQFP